MGLCKIGRGCTVTACDLRTTAMNGRDGVIVSGPEGPDRRYRVIFARGERPKAIKAVNLLLTDDGVGRPSALAAIRHSPALAAEDTCDALCARLMPIVIPELERSTPTLLGGKANEISELGDIHTGADDSDIAWGYKGQKWPSKASKRFVWVQMSAVCHHCFLEWHREDGGWRILQSNIESYTAGEWASPFGKVGIDGGDAHARWGGGQILDDDAISKFWRSLKMLRGLCDCVLENVLLPQLPIWRHESTRFPEEADLPTQQAWVDNANEVSQWATDYLNKAASLGCTAFQTGDRFRIMVGADHLFDIPIKTHQILNSLFGGMTGDDVSRFAYLRMVNYIGYQDCSRPYKDGKVDGYRGFAVQAICAGVSAETCPDQ